MTTSRMLLLLTGLVVTSALGAGCGASVPSNPTWVEDVRPILVARCIRCHQSSVTNDPGKTPNAFGNFDHANFSDFAGADLIYVKMVGDAVAGKIAGSPAGIGFMPPPPSEKLVDWQIETLQRWQKNPM
jgi:hypothetical protein